MKNLFLFLFIFLFCINSYCKDKNFFYLKDIEINNSNRIKSKYYLYIIKNKLGKIIYKKNIKILIKFLFNTNNFINIKVKNINNKLHIYLYEKIFFYKIFFYGNNLFNKNFLFNICNFFYI